jgi:tRNA threonylcarbamoyladenosine modification (KEOPS) complex Cgi121 subunit
LTVAEINKYNSDRGIDKSIAINGRNMTNMVVSQIHYAIATHPAINQEMLLMSIARQLSMEFLLRYILLQAIKMGKVMSMSYV